MCKVLKRKRFDLIEAVYEHLFLKTAFAIKAAALSHLILKTVEIRVRIRIGNEG